MPVSVSPDLTRYVRRRAEPSVTVVSTETGLTRGPSEPNGPSIETTLVSSFHAPGPAAALSRPATSPSPAIRSSIPPWGALSRPETAPPRAIRGSVPAPLVLPVWLPGELAARLVPRLLRTSAIATRPTAVTVTRRSPDRLGRAIDPARRARAIEMLRRWIEMAAAERWRGSGRRRAPRAW